ncbi:MAG: hypothetical protein AAF726_07955 [Planctomycetota bacterium]
MRCLPLVIALALALVPAPAVASPLAQRKVLELAETLESGSLPERIASAQNLAELGRRAAKATPALVRTLAAEEPELVGASVDALVAIGAKAREPLLAALAEGSFEGEPVPPAPVARALLGMGKKGEEAVDAFVAGAEPGPELFAMFEGFGDRGAGYLVAAAGASDEHALEALRSLRRLAAQEVRTAEGIEPALEGVEDEDLAIAARLAWTQTPKSSHVEPFQRWLAGDRLALADTALWGSGVLGKDASKAGAEIASHLDAEEATMRTTALWALGSLSSEGPALPTPSVPASFPGGSKSARAAVEQAIDDQILTVWRDAAKPLGYSGRIGAAARKLWAIAPTWTARVEPVPPLPDASAAPAAFAAAELRLVEMATEAANDPERSEDAVLASRALSANGARSDSVKRMWLGWLSHDSKDRRREALVGLRAFGRDIIDQESLVAKQLGDAETRIAAAQVLTLIATPTSWGAVVESIANDPGKPPLPLLVAISRYDASALRPGLDRFRELYGEGHYIMSAFLLRFGEETVDDFVGQLGQGLVDRRMVAAESLGHLGKAASPAVPKLEKLNERHPIAKQLVLDAIGRIKAGG